MNTQSIFRTGLAATLLASSLFLTNCQGTNGEKGDPGPQGEQGIQGPKGDTGPQGVAGTANVIQYKFTGPTNTSNAYEWGYALTNLPSGVTTANSLVMVYVVPPGSASNGWEALPSILPSNYTGNRPGFYSFTAGNGPTVYVRRRSMDGTGELIPDIPRFAAKIIVVPAAILRNARYPAEFWQDYKAVQTTFKLPD